MESKRNGLAKPDNQSIQALIRGLQRGQSEIVVGWQSHLALLCQKTALWLLRRILLLAMPQSV